MLLYWNLLYSERRHNVFEYSTVADVVEQFRTFQLKPHMETNINREANTIRNQINSHVSATKTVLTDPGSNRKVRKTQT